MIQRPVLGNHVLRNFLRQALPLRQPSPERFDKTFVALTALGLGGRLRRVRQWWGDRQPEAHEQSKSFVRDGDVAFQPFHLSRQPVEPAPECSLHPLRIIRDRYEESAVSTTSACGTRLRLA